MKLFKRAFTLAEVLVAMSIIGVIAAATVPVLTKETQKNQTGPILGRAVAQVETGCRNMIEFANQSNEDAQGYLLGDFLVSELNSGSSLTGSLSNNFVALSPGFLGLEPITDTVSVKNFNNSANEDHSTIINAGAKHKFKKFNASLYMVQEDLSATNDTDATSRVMRFYVDTNGNDSKPNTFGKDVFILEMQNDCRVTAYEVASNTCEKGNITDGTTCAKQIIKDKFRITYY